MNTGMAGHFLEQASLFCFLKSIIRASLRFLALEMICQMLPLLPDDVPAFPSSALFFLFLIQGMEGGGGAIVGWRCGLTRRSAT